MLLSIKIDFQYNNKKMFNPIFMMKALIGTRSKKIYGKKKKTEIKPD